jgi:choline-sulfatase
MAQSTKYNVLFIAVDDLKPILNCYGESQIISPNFDRLANQGVVFDKAYCQWAVCGPSRASIMSGLTPDGTGIRNLSSILRTENPDVVTLPEYFKNNGYVTAGAGKIYDPRNVDAGHDAASWSVAYTDPGNYTYPSEYGSFVGGKQYRVTNKTVTEKGPAGIGDDGYTDGQIAIDALAKLDDFAQNPDQPFFLAVGFKKPHIPFVAPATYWDMYARDNINLAPFQQRADNSPDYAYYKPEVHFDKYIDVPSEYAWDSVDSPNFLLDIATQRRVIHGYYACVSYIDAQLGKLLDKLEAKGLDNNTIILVYGDHGYHLGDHNQWGKHTNFEHSVRAPLIISVPGGSTGHFSDPVEFTDVYSTLCDLAGINIPYETIQGKSLAPALRGESLSKEVAVSEYRADGGSGYSFRTNRYRLSLWFNSSSDRPDKVAWNANSIKKIELYDYDTDPNETKNLADSSTYASEKTDLLAIAEKWWDEQRAFFTNTSGTPTAIVNVQQDDSEVVIFSNPVTDKVGFTLDEPISSITLYNIYGILLYKEIGEVNQINLSGLNTGIYILKFQVGNTEIIKRIVKR